VYSQARYRGGKQRGKINKRRIASVVSGNDRIFRTKEINDTLDTAVFVLVDTSGSMAGSKYTNAAAAAGMLTDCLGKLNIPHAVYGFSFYNRQNKMIKHKDFGQKTSPDDMALSFCSGNVQMVGNADGEAVLWSHDMLIKQKQKRKVLIVLSDGSPAGHGAHNEVGYLKHVIDDIESKSPVELYGIGIEDDNVKRFYSNCVVLDDSEQLEDKLLEVTKNFMVN
jgi:cobalamin biosynthesis protein CobT